MADKLNLRCERVPDPEGHDASLLLRGDWLFVLISDGAHVGLGEATHSGDDAACMRHIQALFEAHVQGLDLSLKGIRALEEGPFSTADGRLVATAMSGLNQALYDLLARRQGVPVWRLFRDEPAQRALPVYATINRALANRTPEDYVSTVSRALGVGFRQVKCAPFERVTGEGDQVRRAVPGLSTLRLLRSEFPGLSLRVDFHKRFDCASFLQLLPEIEALALHWIEEPCPIGPCYAEIRRETAVPVAAGELFFGIEPFLQLASHEGADVVMPDVKHIGGFGPLLGVCAAVAPLGVEVSPHNPSGPVSTLASLQAAAVSPAITSLELPLRLGKDADLVRRFVVDGGLRIPDGPGWGTTFEDLAVLY